ncbi:MAG: hypothetical protein GX808_05990 [Syntrophomonadaceae bacterium]|nr:hypothetical protein [Syntrophomonadaceae bacterium]
MAEKSLYEAYQKLFESLCLGGLARICLTAYEILQRPVLIVNNELNKLEQFPPKPLGDPIWDELLENGRLAPQTIWKLREEGLMEYSEKSDIPSWTNWGMVKNRPRLVCTVKISGVVKGYVAVFFEEDEYCHFHVQITQMFSQVVSLELQKYDHPEYPNYPTITTAFVIDLFQGMIKSHDILSNWEKRIDNKLKPHFCVAVVGGDDQVSTTIHYVRRYLVKEKNIYDTIIKGNLYILFTDINTQIDFSEILNSRFNSLTESLDMYNLSLGLSDSFENLLNIDIYKYQAEQALFLGKSCRHNSRIYLYKDLMLENMISHLKNNDKAVSYIHPAIKMLEIHDKTNNTEYLKTLEVYIMSMCNPAKTVENMHIHRNTLLYRLKRIQELTDISLDDEHLCALLLINFYILE